MASKHSPTGHLLARPLTPKPLICCSYAMKPSPALPTLLFALRGRFLLAVSDGHVEGYCLDTGARVYRIPGALLGVSSDDASFLLWAGEKRFEAYRVETGEALSLRALGPDHFPVHVRFFVYGDVHPQAQAVSDKLQIVDALGLERERVISAGAGEGYRIEQWAVVPNRRVVAAAIWGGPMGYDTAFGRFVAFEGGEVLSLPIRGFSPCRFSTPPPLSFSVEHDLLLSGSQSHTKICDLKQRDPTNAEVYVSPDGGDVGAISPKDASLLALNHRPSVFAERPVAGFRLVNWSSGGMHRTVLWLAETKTAVQALAFHPEGHCIAAMEKSGEIALFRADSGDRIATLGGASASPVRLPDPSTVKIVSSLERRKKQFELSCGGMETIVATADRASVIAKLKTLVTRRLDDTGNAVRVWKANGHDALAVVDALLVRAFPAFANEGAQADLPPPSNEKDGVGAGTKKRPPRAELWVLTQAESLSGIPLFTEQRCLGLRKNPAGQNVLVFSIGPMEGTTLRQDEFLEDHPEVIAYAVFRLRE